MANIDEDLQKIKNAVKGAEVRDSIHDAIRDINDQTENILSDVQTQVSGIVDEAINDNVLLFRYDPSFFVDDDIHTDSSITWDTVSSKPLTYIQLQWHITDERDLTVFNSKYDCIGITLSVEESVGYLYFNNTYTGTIIKVTIPTTGSNDTFSFTEISQSGLQPGTGINISNNTVSVDTTEIQEKLIAGTGITITDNTISSTGGSGSSDALHVIYTLAYNQTTFDLEATCNYTCSEMSAAVSSNKDIIVSIIDEDGIIYDGTSVITYNTSFAIDFYYIYYNVVSGAICTKEYSFSHGNNDAITVTDHNVVASQPMLIAGNGIRIASNVISSKTKSNGGVLADSSGLYVDDTKFQTKLTSSNAGNGISISNGVISIDLQNAEDNSF